MKSPSAVTSLARWRESQWAQTDPIAAATPGGDRYEVLMVPSPRRSQISLERTTWPWHDSAGWYGECRGLLLQAGR